MRWLAGHSQARGLLVEELHLRPETRTWPHAREPVLPKGSKPGDIDLLCCHPAQPNEAIAIECKRVKITPLDPARNQANKIDAIREGVVQANHLRARGLYRTYLCIISAIDAAAQTHWNVLNRGIDPAATGYDERTTFKRIVEFPDREDLHKDIGIIFFEIIQPTGRSAANLVSVGICLHHAATPQDQPVELTNRIIDWLQQSVAS